VPGARLFHGRGCEECTHTGFRGRSCISELLVLSDKLRQLILKQSDAAQIRDGARKAGMRTLLEDGISKAVAGVTTLEEVLRETVL